MSANELYHHGIDGQRWGVKHGPPYPLDRADHNKVVEKSKKATEKRHLSYTSSRKYAKRMTDKDLNDTIDRLQREETYRRLVSGEKTSNKLAKKQLKATKEANKLRKEEQKLNRERFEEEKKNNSIGRKAFEKAVLTATQSVINKLTGDWLKNLDNKKENKSKDEDKPKENETSKNQNDHINDLEKKKKKLDYELERNKQKREIITDFQDHSLDDSYWDTKADEVLKKIERHAPYSEDAINKILLERGDGL